MMWEWWYTSTLFPPPQCVGVCVATLKKIFRQSGVTSGVPYASAE